MAELMPSYWPTRIMLAIGFVATVMVVLLAPTLVSPCISCDNASVLGVPSNVLEAALAVGLAIVGLAWMLRIFRGTPDEPRAWRYRDR